MIRNFHLNLEEQTKKEEMKEESVLVEGIKSMCCQSDAALKKKG